MAAGPLLERWSRWLGRKESDAARGASPSALYRAAQFADAEALCLETLKRTPDDADALHILGLVALRRSQFAVAARHLERAAACAPGRIDIAHDLGEALALAGRPARAVEAYERVAAATPADAREEALIANALLRLERFDEATARTATALQRDPNDADALIVAARLAMRNGDPAAAIGQLQLAMRERPQDPALLSELALLLVGQGRDAESEALLRRALDLAPAERLAQYAVAELVAARVPRGDSLADGGTGPADGSVLKDAPAGPGASPQPFISIIICSVNAAKFAAVSANYALRLAGHPHEIIGIHDAKSLCEGYNRGVARARGDIIIFSHDDIEIVTPDFGARLKAHLARHDVVGPCGTSLLVAGHWMSAGWPHMHGLVVQQMNALMKHTGAYQPMVMDTSGESSTGRLCALDGLFIAANRRVLERCRFDEQTFDGFHLYDLSFTFDAFLAGFDVAAFRDIIIVHRSKADAPGYEEAFQHYKRLFEAKYAAELARQEAAPMRFIPVLFDTADEARRFCEDLLAFRRSLAPAHADQE